MATGPHQTRPRPLACWLVLVALAPMGCSQAGPLTSRQASLGTLKASVSQLEFENQKLKREVGELQAENSRLDTQLAQELEARGEVTAGLDESKDRTRREKRASAPAKFLDDEEIPPPVTIPQGRRIKSRKPPSVEIPRIEPSQWGDDPGPSTSSNAARRPRDLGPVDRDDEDRWLPVARGLGSQIRK